MSGASASGSAPSTSAAWRGSSWAITKAITCGCSWARSCASAAGATSPRLGVRPAGRPGSASRSTAGDGLPPLATSRAKRSPSTRRPSRFVSQRHASSCTRAACSRGIERRRAMASETCRTSCSFRWRKTRAAASTPSVRRRIAAFSAPVCGAGRRGAGSVASSAIGQTWGAPSRSHSRTSCAARSGCCCVRARFSCVSCATAPSIAPIPRGPGSRLATPSTTGRTT